MRSRVVHVAWWCAESGHSCIVGVFENAADARSACLRWVPDPDDWVDDDAGSFLWVNCDAWGNTGTFAVLRIVVQRFRHVSKTLTCQPCSSILKARIIT